MIAVLVGVKLNAWLRSAADCGDSSLAKKEENPLVVKKGEDPVVVKREENPLAKEEDYPVVMDSPVKKEEDSQFAIPPPSSDFAFSLMKGEEERRE